MISISVFDWEDDNPNFFIIKQKYKKEWEKKKYEVGEKW